jgi:hypothetical protein
MQQKKTNRYVYITIGAMGASMEITSKESLQQIFLISVISVLTTEITTSGQTNSVVNMFPNKLHNFEHLKEFQDKF